MSKAKLLIMAGGTGGHVFPGLAVAQQLQQQGWQIDWLGTANRMEAQLVPKHGYPIHFIDVAGVRGNGLLRKLKAPFQVVAAIWQAYRVLKQIKPDLVLGMGGYASGPGGIAAWLNNIPLILHEQNAAAGMTNRILSHFAKVIFTAFDDVFSGNAAFMKKLTLVGNPVRVGLIAKEDRKVKLDAELNVLIIGGSLGAKILNDTLPKTILALSKPINVWHQVGEGNQDAVLSEYQRYDLTGVKVSDFIDDMDEAYAWADLLICRAGALTVSEVAAAGLPAVFVPLPYAVDDHQTKNALWLVNSQAAKLVAQKELTTDTLADIISGLDQNREQLQVMGKKARNVAIVDAAERVAASCEELIKSTSSREQ